LKLQWVHSPHLCRTLAHRVVRVGRLLQARPKVSRVVCHRNYCPGLLTHGSGHPSIGNCGHIRPQDSFAAPDTETRFPCLQTRSGAQNTGDRAQARRKGSKVPEQAIFSRDDACTVRRMSTKSRFREGNGDCPRQFENGMVLSIERPLAAFSSAKAASPRKPLNFKQDDKTAID
jgi:hypothetical protein